MTQSLRFFASAPRAMEPLLADELRDLGVPGVAETRAGVFFSGGLEAAYRVCLWSRLASRVQLPLAEFEVATPEDLYRAVQGIRWSEHISADGTLAVDFSARQSRVVRHTHFGALKVKDAIVDQLREEHGRRPGIDVERPDVRISVFLNRTRAHVNLDLSGQSLHRRGYRSEGVAAPLKENLAAAILYRGGWPAIAARGGDLIDPMCGSGTLLIEGALMAADWAPGLNRDYFGFLGWLRNDPALWSGLKEEAEGRRERGLRNMPLIVGYDRDRRAVAAARENVQRAGVGQWVRVERKSVQEVLPPEGRTGLVAVNPPYGERLGDEASAAQLYGDFGELLKSRFLGWQVVMIVADAELGFRVGIRSQKPVTLYNGAIECKVLRFEVDPAAFFVPRPLTAADPGQARLQRLMHKARMTSREPGSGAEMFANRLRKNLKNLGRWARRQGVNCYRLYDADLPEYALAVDVYAGEKTCVVAQEYEAPKSIDPEKADGRLCEALAVLPEVLGVPPEQLFLKVRRRQKSKGQYQKSAETGNFMEVVENGCRFLVNFEDYLDTGLFLDHRITRAMLRDLARGKSFLNLFAYTGTATVYAALGGAAATTTVDMSATYLDWARKNLALNGIAGSNHEFVQADCLEWLDDAAAAVREVPSGQPGQAGAALYGASQRKAVRPPRRYGLIFLDPPTFSNSKRMQGTFDVRRDHGDLILKAAALLEPGGVLIFSTNCRQFKMDREALSGLKVEDITAATIPEDFARNPKIHYCWKITS